MLPWPQFFWNSSPQEPLQSRPPAPTSLCIVQLRRYDGDEGGRAFLRATVQVQFERRFELEAATPAVGDARYVLRASRVALQGSSPVWEGGVEFASAARIDIPGLASDTLYKVEAGVASSVGISHRLQLYVLTPPDLSCAQAGCPRTAELEAIVESALAEAVSDADTFDAAATPPRLGGAIFGVSSGDGWDAWTATLCSLLNRPHSDALETLDGTLQHQQQQLKEKKQAEMSAQAQEEKLEEDLEKAFDAVYEGFSFTLSLTYAVPAAVLRSSYHASGFISSSVLGFWRRRTDPGSQDQVESRQAQSVYFNPETEIYYFECPHCGLLCEVPVVEIRCTIFRHAIFKDGMRYADPHAPKAQCEKWVADGLVYGCGKPFRFDGRTVEVCDYI